MALLAVLPAVMAALGVQAQPQAERVLYIRADFADKPFSASDATLMQRLQAIDAEAEDFWTHNTYGQIDGFDSTYTPVFTLGDALTANSPFGSGADYWAIRTGMRNAARDAGYNLNQYDQIILSFPGLPAFPAGALGTPGTVWMPGENPFAGGYTHEFGHALGLGHAHHWEGGSAVYPGETRGGRDGLFMMGSEGGTIWRDGRRAPINLPMRYRIGVVDEQLVNRPDYTGVYRIFDFDRSDISDDLAEGRSLATVFDYDNKEFWVSFAPGLAENWAHQGGEVYGYGVVVSDLDNAITHSLDFTPGSQGGTGNEEDYVDTRDGALVVGASYTFPGNGPTLAPLATGIDEHGVRWIDVHLILPGGNRPGDLDGDGFVGAADLEILLNHWGDSVVSGSLIHGDVVANGVIDDADLQVVLDHWGQGIRPGTPIPEPGSLALLALGGLALRRRRPTSRRARFFVSIHNSIRYC